MSPIVLVCCNVFTRHASLVRRLCLVLALSLKQLFSIVSDHLLQSVRPNLCIAGTPQCANFSWVRWWSQQTYHRPYNSFRILCWLYGICVQHGVPQSEETWPACNLSVIFCQRHQNILNEFGLVEWAHVRAVVCIIKLQCFSAGIRSPNAGFITLSNGDLAKLFAMRGLLQMNESSVREASK